MAVPDESISGFTLLARWAPFGGGWDTAVDSRESEAPVSRGTSVGVWYARRPA